MAIPRVEGCGGGMDNHLDGSHLGDTGHIRRFDSSWKKEERKKRYEKVRMSQ